MIFSEVSEALIQQLVSAATLVLVSLIGIMLRKLALMGVAYLKARLSAEHYATLQMVASTAVRFLEQSPVFQDWDGSQKKERAIGIVLDFAKRLNLPLDYEFADTLIEEAVQVMNSELFPLEVE